MVTAPLPPVVMLGGRGGTLSVARSLGRAGIEVHVLGDAASLVRFSRFCTSFVDLGIDDRVQERWLDWLDGGPEGAVILSCHDDGLELVAHNRAKLVERGFVPFEADDEVLLALLDKQRTYALAERAGIPAPRIWTLGGREDLDRAKRELAYPCALKPRHSHRFAKEFGAKLIVVGTDAELERAFERTLAAGMEMILTEIVPGRDDLHCSYYTYIDERGEPLFHLTKRKLRQYPIHHGLGCYHLTDWNPEVAELGLRLLREIGVRGLAIPEFKRDERDGQLKLIEVNHRFTAVNELIRAAGIDLALLTYARLTGRPTSAVDGYRRGQGMWFPTQDVRALLAYRGNGELGVGEWARSLTHRQRPALFSGDDPLPSLANLPTRALASLRRTRAAAAGGAAPTDA
jgi:predicted ATP-grasp superfamily ATP-dependent carboligase